MKAGWVGNLQLQAMVAARDGGVMLHPEVVQVVDSDVRVTKTQWAAGTVTGGSVETLEGGGARLLSTATSLIPATVNDGTNTTQLTHIAPFDVVLIEWLDAAAEDREIHNLVARLDPRRDGAQAKTVDTWICELFRVAEVVDEGEGIYALEALSPPVRVTATGEVAADFTFDFQGFSGPYPMVGPPPIGTTDPFARPLTVIRISALRSDGTVADNVTWLSDSVEGESKTDGSTYLATHYTGTAVSGLGQEYAGGNVFAFATTVASFPEFTFNRTDYTAATITFDGANDFDDQPGTGDLVIVAQGETPSDSVLTYEISDDGVTWEDCFDGDEIGVDNAAQGGGDLTSISTTGPWRMRVTLTPSTAADLNTPAVRALGIERVVSTFLTGAAHLVGGHRQIDPVSLVGNIATAELVVEKAGEPDYRDYGSDVLARNHIGDIHVRLWLADTERTVLARSEWMLHSVWDIDDYLSDDTHHVISLVSPLRRLNVLIPPFKVTSGNDGTRSAEEIPTTPGTVKDAYDEIMDTWVALPGRFRGASPDDDTNTVAKTITRADAKDELDRLAYLSGGSIIESQGKVQFVKVMRDGPGGDIPVARFPLGSYHAGPLGPGYSTRTDEFFVPYNWHEGSKRFEDERRYLNSVALGKLGGVGLNTTQTLDEETAKWITTQALADLVGDRVPNHFATGQIIFPIRSHERHPELEPGDCVWIETTRFVGRSPLNSQEVRGRVAALAIVTQVRDPWGQDLEVWVPSFDHLVVGTGTVTRRGFGQGPMHLDTTGRSHTGNTTKTALETVALPVIRQYYGFRVKCTWAFAGTAGTKTVEVEIDDGTITPDIAQWQMGATDLSLLEMDFIVTVLGNASARSSSPVQGSPTLTHLPTADLTIPVNIVFSVTLGNAADSVVLAHSEIELLSVTP